MQVDEIVNVHEAKTHFSRLLREVGQGRRIAIARNGEPVALLSSIADDSVSIVERRLGAVTGTVRMSPDFDDIPPDFGEYSEPVAGTGPGTDSVMAPETRPAPESMPE